MSRPTLVAVGLLALGLLATGSLAQPLRALEALAAAPRPGATAPAVSAVSSAGTTPTTQPAMSTPPPATAAFAVDEATLTAQLQAWLAGQPVGQTPLGTATAQDLAVQLRDDQLVITGMAQAGPVRLPVELAATAVVQSGQVLVEVREVQVGGVSLPESMRGELQQHLQDQVEQALARSRLVPQSVHIGQGKLVVVGTQP